MAGAHTVDVSQGKAYAAASFRRATGELMEHELLRFIPKALMLSGGLPINLNGEHYGVIGVSGAPPRERLGDIDAEWAQAGIDVVRGMLRP